MFGRGDLDFFSLGGGIPKLPSLGPRGTLVLRKEYSVVMATVLALGSASGCNISSGSRVLKGLLLDEVR